MATVSTIPTPQEFLGFAVGEDRKLADWPQILGYFQALACTSDRVRVVELGKTTEGNPLILAIFAAPAILAELDRYRELHDRLFDPRRSSAEEAEEIIRHGKAPVLITSSVHATEVGPAQSAPLIAHRLATATDEETWRILENIILLYVPCLNPDGLRTVKRWYDSTLDTPYEGTPPPQLYHKYAGHDNNRDWFMFTQIETRLLVEKVHNVWHPVVVHDQHQMGRDGVRMFLPPFDDPYDPNIDPILQQETAAAGLIIAQELTAQGKTGIAVNCIFDAYTPSRQYQLYHGGVRILSELASVKIATPVTIRAEELRPGRGIDPRLPSWRQPAPWPGGVWRLADIINYNVSATFALLDHVARYRDRWLRHQRAWAQKAVEGEKKPYAYLVPAEQRDPGAAAEMLDILRFGLVEIEAALAPFSADGVTYPAGTFVIRLAQPCGSFAKTMLELQSYPDLREYPNGPPKRPYDMTAHALPLLLGVNTIAVRNRFEAQLVPVSQIKPPAGCITGSAAGHPFLLGAETNASVRAVNRLLAQGREVERVTAAFVVDGKSFAPGTYLLRDSDPASVSALADALGLHFHRLNSPPDVPVVRLRLPRVGLYQPWIPNTDEGWTRWIFEHYELPYQTLHDADIRQGALSDRLDALILTAEQTAEQIQHGLKEGEYPPEYVGGLGERGAAAVRAFVEGGGTLIAIDSAGDWAIEQLALPVQNVLKEVGVEEFYAPGSILRVVLETDHPLAYGLPRACNAMFVNSPAFEMREGTVVGYYPLTNPLLSGWIRGPERLCGRAALVEVPVGRGRVILLGFRVQFRAQARSTYRLLFNAIYRSVMGNAV